MLNVIIPGFAADKSLFEEFMRYAPPCEYLELDAYHFNATQTRLEALSRKNGKINIFAWSLGTLFALKWAILYPERTASLFLTGATARFCETENYANGISPLKIGQMQRLIRIKPERVLTDFYQTVFNFVPEKKRYLDLLSKKIHPAEHLDNGLKILQEMDLLAELPLIRVPVMIYQGEHDPVTPPAGAHILQAKIPAAVLTLKKNGGHSLFLESAEECAAVWKDFLCTVN